MKRKSNKKYIQFWKDLWKLITPSQKQAKTIFLLILLFEGVKLISPYILKIIIDSLTNFETAELGPILIWLGLYFLTIEFNSFVIFFRDKKIFKVLIDVEYYLEIEAQKKLVFLSLSYHEKENTGNNECRTEIY